MNNLLAVLAILGSVASILGLIPIYKDIFYKEKPYKLKKKQKETIAKYFIQFLKTDGNNDRKIFRKIVKNLLEEDLGNKICDTIIDAIYIYIIDNPEYSDEIKEKMKARYSKRPVGVVFKEYLRITFILMCTFSMVITGFVYILSTDELYIFQGKLVYFILLMIFLFGILSTIIAYILVRVTN